jgi:phage tail protein X
MTVSIISRDGDMLDAICKRHYGRESLVPLVLRANPQLAKQPAILPAGGVSLCVLIFPFRQDPATSPRLSATGLLELSITDEAGIKSDQLKLTLDDRRRENGAIASLPDMGTSLSVSLGYAESGLRDMGSYLMDEIELRHPPATLSVSARAADMSGPFHSRKTRSWEASSLADTHREKHHRC